MLEKDPLGYSLATYAWVFFLSLFGSVANYVHQVKTGKVERVVITGLLGDFIVSGFFGLMTFYMCEASSITPPLSAVLIGFAGHMGRRSWFAFKKALSYRLGIIVENPEEKNGSNNRRN